MKDFTNYEPRNFSHNLSSSWIIFTERLSCSNPKKINNFAEFDNFVQTIEGAKTQVESIGQLDELVAKTMFMPVL